MAEFSLMQRLRRKVAHKVPVGRAPFTLPRGALSITFDDAPRSAWTVAGRVLREHGVRGTYYICGGLLGARYRDIVHCTHDDVAAIVAEGHEIGCHTFDHLSALSVTAEQFDRSISRNAAHFSAALPGIRMRTFAFPFGDVSLTAKWCVRSRFEAARGIAPGLNDARAERSHLRAVALERRQRRAHDLGELIRTAARERLWLILFTHDVADEPSPYGCTPADLAEVLALAKRAGLLIAPVASVLEAAAQADGVGTPREAAHSIS